MYSILFFILSFSFVLGILDLEYHKAELRNRPKSLISVETELGTLIGYKQQVHHQRVFSSEGFENQANASINVFYGVPYAQPPVEELRFRRTRPMERFPTNPYNALQHKPHCAQRHAKKYHAEDRFDEDCLYANIWTPDLENARDANGKCKKLYTVMIYLVGGKSSIYQTLPFKTKNENDDYLLYSGELMALQDSILFIFNFR